MPARASKSHPVPSSLTGVSFKALPMSASSYRRQATGAFTEVIARVRCEWVEMRGFSPTVDQAARLFQINREECGQILKGLVDEGFLTQTADGRFRLPSQQ